MPPLAWCGMRLWQFRLAVSPGTPRGHFDFYVTDLVSAVRIPVICVRPAT
ncbi:MAG TPA: hypothetical protein VHZ03_50820 [Trebonia sp.]|nr:hypothetical protein [Trebonia sp.]